MAYNIDPDFTSFLEGLPDDMPYDDPVAMREGLEAMSAAMSGDVDVSMLELCDRVIPGPDGAPDVPVRLYGPRQKAAVTPAIFYIHGGGFTVGSLETEHASAACLARELGVVVLSVGYRLAPEHPYPAGLEDCYAALVWLHDHDNALSLGIDAGRIAVFGQSAGGGLAAALALLARDRGGPALCFQFLGIPELDDRLDTPSMRTFVDTPLWHRPAAQVSWTSYLGAAFEAGADDVPAYAAPARATDLHALPSAYISAMEFDPLRDEAIHYGLKLLEAGVAVELHTFPGTFHGSSLVAKAAISRRQQAETLAVLRRALSL